MQCPAFIFTNISRGIVVAKRLQGHILWHGGWGPGAAEHTPAKGAWKRYHEGFRPYYIIGKKILTSQPGYKNILLLSAQPADQRQHLLSSMTLKAKDARRMEETQATSQFQPFSDEDIDKIFAPESGRARIAINCLSPGMLHTRDVSLFHRPASYSEVIIRARAASDEERAMVEDGPTNQEYDDFAVPEYLGLLAVAFNIEVRYKALLTSSDPESGDT